MWVELVERMLADEPDVAVKHAFGSPGLRYRDKLFALHVRDELVVKLAPGRCEELSEDGGARPFRSGGRELREWVVVGAEREFEWDALADEALAYARALAA
ncbi:MAG: hypothetical protein JWQ18_1353 [Conexibacter sp.]|nr:hypothetical protein [Conexibacter sp.]